MQIFSLMPTHQPGKHFLDIPIRWMLPLNATKNPRGDKPEAHNCGAPAAKANRLHPEYVPHPGAKLFFQFDEARNSRAWKKLHASFKDNFTPYVVLLGQFETGSRFGHMGGYMHELILVDVLDNKSNATP